MSSLASPSPAAHPLQPTKRVHHPSSTMIHTPTSKRARFNTDAEMMTPHPSSDVDVEVDHFKLPSGPIRVSNGPMTPSTSTVAFSSSPRQIMSSSPTRSAFSHSHPYKSLPARASEVEHDLVLTHDTSFIFGRHRHNGASSTSSSLASSVPRHLSHLLACPFNEATTIHLSRHASHASRVHAVIELLHSESDEDVLRILVVGQNGLRVRVPNRKKAVRLLQGQRFDTPISSDGIEVDFFGSKAVVRTQIKTVIPVLTEDQEETRRERLFSSSPVSPIRRVDNSLPPSSPPLSAVDLDFDEQDEDEDEDGGENEDEEKEVAEEQEDVNLHFDSRASSPLSPPAESIDLPDIHLPSPPAEEPITIDDKAIKAEHIEQVTPANAKAASRAPSPVTIPSKPLPADIDLPAIIASTVVFSGSSKLSLPDLVKHMLESQPSLKEHGDEPQWSIWVHDALKSNEMFGKVERHGKDSSGHPLLPHYFYNPASDPDASRAKELGGLVRPLRAAQRAGGKAIDWRPVGRGRKTHAWNPTK